MSNSRVSVVTPAVSVTFYDNFIPALKDGDYTIAVEQKLTDAAGGHALPLPAPVKQRFAVRGPRFTLPPADIHRVFPPANATGSFAGHLPLIVFNKRTLPWERGIRLTAEQISHLPPDARDPALYPWMALLVFAADELLPPELPDGTLPPVPAAGNQQNPAVLASVPLNNAVNGTYKGNKTTGPPTGTLGPSGLALADDEDPRQTFCNVIDVLVSTFIALAPTLADLRLLAHVREASTENKEPQDAVHDGWYSTAISSRFAVPAAGPQRNVVHLVSLEGMEAYLGADEPLTMAAFAGFQKVRLVSLQSWTYTELPKPKENFRELMLGLLAPQGAPDKDLLLHLTPATTAQTDIIPPAVAERLWNGYVPLSYSTRSGEETFAWYRGPLAPVATVPFLSSPDPEALPDASAPQNAAEAMVYDPAAGVFDQSYAVAFQTGRSLALADLPFATSLLQWRREIHNRMDLLNDRLRSPHLRGLLQSRKGLLKDALSATADLTSEAGLDTLLGATPVTDLLGLLDEKLVVNTFRDYLADGFHQSVARTLGRNGNLVVAPDRPRLQAARPLTTAPVQLRQLLKKPVVGALVHHLSGLATVGTTAEALTGTVTRVLLQAETAVALDAGTTIAVISPDGQTTVRLTTTEAVGRGEKALPIEPHTFRTAMPPGSTVQLTTPLMPRLVVDWLARTALLYGVPFNNLVAHPDLLPQESIRFFYLDPNWTAGLLDGALSAGIQSSRDSQLQQVVRGALHAKVGGLLGQVRDVRRKVSASPATPAGTLAGFVLRSAVVSGWPGLEVRAWSEEDAVNPMKPLRLDRVAPGLMLGIFPAVPVRIELNEPSEGLVFGVEEQGVLLRYLPQVAGATPQNIGERVAPESWLPPADMAALHRDGRPTAPLRIAGADGLAGALATRLAVPTTALGPAALAVQMVMVPKQMLFTTK